MEAPYDIVINDLRILNETMNYSLKLRSVSLIEYILKGAEDLFINASITEEQLLPLLINQNDEICQKILKFIVTKDVIIVNDGSLKLEDSLIENYQENEEIMYGSLGDSKENSDFEIKQATIQPSQEKSVAKNKTVLSIDDPVLFKSK